MNIVQNPAISVVVPVFNSEGTLEEVFSRTSQVLESMAKSFELIFVDDGSKDRSWEVLQEIKEKDPEHITAISLHQNFGQHNATVCGLTFARGDLIITLDDDLQHAPEDISKLLETLKKEDPDIVYGIFRSKKHSWLRNFWSKSIKTASKSLLKGTGKGSSFRLMKKEIVDKLLEHTVHFVFIDQLLLWHTSNIAFVEVEHHKRREKKSGYSARKLFSLATDITYFYTNIPLKLMVYGGLFVSLFFFLFGLRYILQKLFFHVSVPGYASLIVTIMFSTGIIVFSLGIIGGYLSRIYMMQNKRPTFTIKKIL